MARLCAVVFLILGSTVFAQTRIAFYSAPWCGHCQQFYPHWTAVKYTLATRGYAVLMEEKECSGVSRQPGSGRDSYECQMAGVQTYPTIKVMVPGDAFGITYQGQRTQEALLTFLESVLQPSTNEAAPTVAPSNEASSNVASVSNVAYPPPRAASLNVATASANIAKKKIVSAKQSATYKRFVFYYAPWCQLCEQLLMEFKAAKSTHSAGGSTITMEEKECSGASRESGQDYDECESAGIVGYPTIKFHDVGDVVGEAYSGDHSQYALLQHLALLEPPVFTPTQQMPAVQHTLEMPRLVFYYAPWCGHCQQFFQHWNYVKQRNFELNNALIMDEKECYGANRQAGKDYTECQMAGVQAFPTVKFYGVGDLFGQVYHGQRTHDALLTYIAQVTTASTILF